MNFSPNERNVVNTLRQKQVATAKELLQLTGVARSTITRALTKQGYYSSCNHNRQYLTLRETPHFDEDGLWRWDNVCFSRHPSLPETILQLVNRSRQGCTTQELQARLHTRVHNHVNHLLRERQLQRCWWGRRVVYLCQDPQRAAWQQEQRQRRDGPQTDGFDLAKQESLLLPPHCSLAHVLDTLRQLIRTPHASPASLAKQMQSRGVVVSASQTREIMEFFDLQEKRGPWRSPP
jgi:hypothetical protein